jgi:predicted transglutaminase-like cysteine proteinase
MARRAPSIDQGAMTKLVAQYDSDVDRCARSQRCNLPASFFSKLKMLRDLQPWEQLRQVDSWVNAFPYRMVDGPGNTVASFLKAGGSCKEYVLTKLVILRDLGFKLEDLWAAHVVVPGERHHLILLVRIDGVLMVLSNSTDANPAPAMLAMSPFNDYQAIWIVRLPDHANSVARDEYPIRQCG